ncbi:response regulator [Candidatus Kapabacteria bacterium]|nr:response regulator [Candidatus Kapabacteria bacterium]
MSDKSNPIAIVEDNTPIRKLFSTLLKKAGHQIIEFENGESAMEGLKNTSVSTIILDILLPDRNGSDMIGELRGIKGYDKIPIIAITGFAQASDRQKFIDLGFDAYLAKPINTSSFVEEINTIRDEKFKK